MPWCLISCSCRPSSKTEMRRLLRGTLTDSSGVTRLIEAADRPYSKGCIHSEHLSWRASWAPEYWAERAHGCALRHPLLQFRIMALCFDLSTSRLGPFHTPYVWQTRKTNKKNKQTLCFSSFDKQNVCIFSLTNKMFVFRWFDKQSVCFSSLFFMKIVCILGVCVWNGYRRDVEHCMVLQRIWDQHLYIYTINLAIKLTKQHQSIKHVQRQRHSRTTNNMFSTPLFWTGIIIACLQMAVANTPTAVVIEVNLRLFCVDVVDGSHLYTPRRETADMNVIRNCPSQ